MGKITRYKFKCIFYKILFNQKKVKKYINKIDQCNKKIDELNQIKAQGIARYEENKKLMRNLLKYKNNKQYLLTCFVITYNQKDLISKCLDSLLEQDTSYPYLIKILDDGSSDGTLEICWKYAKKNPDKIEVCTVSKNSTGKLLTVCLERLSTKYFCCIDGDDFWCCKNKIQIALDFLEKNPDYTNYVHDTCVYDTKSKIERSNVHFYEPNKNYKDSISMDNFFYIHLSSRIHKNILDFKDKYKNIRKRDRILWYLLLEAGKTYYDDKMLAVYNLSPKGIHANMHSSLQRLSRILILYNVNKFLNFKYDDSFTKQAQSKFLVKSKKIFGKYIGWKIFILKLKYFDRFRIIFKVLRSFCIKYQNDYKNVLCCTSDYQKNELKIIERVRSELQ